MKGARPAPSFPAMPPLPRPMAAASPALEGHFTAVGRFPFRRTGVVSLSNTGTDGHVAVDAVRWVPVP